MKHKRDSYSIFLHGILVVLAILVLLLSIENRELQAQPNGTQRSSLLNTGDSIPAIQVNELDGRTAELRFDSAERPTVAMVFSTTCDICEESVDHWIELHQQLGGSHDFVAIGIDKEPQAVHSFVARHALPFRVVTPQKRLEFARGYGIVGVPKTLLINPGGRVEKIQVGRPEGW